MMYPFKFHGDHTAAIIWAWCGLEQALWGIYERDLLKVRDGCANWAYGIWNWV